MNFKLPAFALFSLSISAYASPNAIEIKTDADFARITRNPWGSYFLSRDIDFKGRKIESIDFCGNLDGKNHIIRNFEAKNNDLNAVGLFRSIGSGKCRDNSAFAIPLVKNLIISNDSIKGNDFVGSLAGSIVHSSINNIKAYAKIRGRNFVGGISGQIDSLTTLEDVEFFGTIEGRSHIGGLVGKMRWSSVIYGYSNSKIIGTSSLGGISGSANNSFISTVISEGTIIGDDTIGGILGVADGKVSKLSRTPTLLQRAGQVYKQIEHATYYFEPKHVYVRIPESLGDEEDGIIDISDSIRLTLKVISTSSLSHISGNRDIGGVIGVSENLPWASIGSIFSGTVSGISNVGKYCGSCELLSPIQLFLDAGTLSCTEKCFNPFGNTNSDVINFHNLAPGLSESEISYFKELARQHFAPYHWFPTDHFGGIYLLKSDGKDSLVYQYIDSSGAMQPISGFIPVNGRMLANPKYPFRHDREKVFKQLFIEVFGYPNIPARPIRKIELLEGGVGVSLHDKFLNRHNDSLRFTLFGDTTCFRLTGDTISMRCCPENRKASIILQTKSWRRFSQNIRLFPVGVSSKCSSDSLSHR